MDRALNPAQLGETPINEHTLPLLTNPDIGGLIDALTKDNKLGNLRGKTRVEQEAVFREKAGRELLVAMIEATSGERFEVKAVKEYEELEEPSKKRIYAAVAVATAFQIHLSKTDLLIAIGKQDNVLLNALDQLVRRNIIVKTEGGYRARHRVIAELVLRCLQNSGQLYDVMHGLLVLLASRVSPDSPKNSKSYRQFVRLINNGLLHQLLGPEQARNLYADLEPSLKNEAHFWLQRGCLEVESGNLKLAKNWLDQAKGISPEDDFVETEYALWEFRTALQNPKDVQSQVHVEEACKALEHQIALNGKRYEHSYHVLASQCLAWVRKGMDRFEEQRDFLEYGIEKLKDGTRNHPMSARLKTLLKEMEDERLHLVLQK